MERVKCPVRYVMGHTLLLLFKFSHNLRNVSSQCLLIRVITELPVLLVAPLVYVIIDSPSSKTEMLSVFALYVFQNHFIFAFLQSFSNHPAFYILNPFLCNLQVKIENFLTVSHNAAASCLAKTTVITRSGH